jgi:CxxC motif-containing protein (DUF1111 family)
MRSRYYFCYAVVLVLLLGPLGLRVLTRPADRVHVADQTAAEQGRMLFTHVWTANDPLCASGDGLGPVYNATSCLACHKQGGIGGGGGREHNVTMFTMPTRDGKVRSGVLHAEAIEFQETLRDLDPRFPAIARPPLEKLTLQLNCAPPAHRIRADLLNLSDEVALAQRNTPALFGARLIDEIAERVIIAGERYQRLRYGGAAHDTLAHPVGRALRLADGRVGRFGWKAQSASLSNFVRAACAGELGLSNPGHDQPKPLSKPDYPQTGLDLTAQQCDQITAFVAALPRPEARLPLAAAERHQVAEGERQFHAIGCAECHTPQLGSVAGLYSDLLLHRIGRDLDGTGSYNGRGSDLPSSPGDLPLADEWRTPPLWGVADSGPYLHDGRADTLEDAILSHAGQAARAAGAFAAFDPPRRDQVIAFLKSLRAP